MNVLLLHKKVICLMVACMVFAGFGQLSSQNSGLDIHDIPVIVNDTLHFQFSHYHVAVAPKIEKAPKNGRAFFKPGIINGRFGTTGFPSINHLYYVPNTGFLGTDTIEILYFRNLGDGNSIIAYKILNISVLPSYLIAQNDYATTSIGQEIDIDVLANDFGNGTNLTIADIPIVNHGTAERTSGNKKLRFRPAPGFSGVAHLNYTICDAQGSCDVAVVSVSVNSINPPSLDSIFVTTGRNTPQVLFHDLGSDLNVVGLPSNGTIVNDDAITYIPNLNFVGTDKVIFNNAANDKTRVVQIKVLNTPNKNTFLIEDIVFTPKGEKIEQINLLANDKGGNLLQNVGVTGYPNTEKGGQLIYLPSLGKGVYQYIPPPNFEGIDKFTYSATPPNSNTREYATCHIVISNLNPVKPVFQFTTPKNTPFIIGNHLPITNYQFTNFRNGGNQGTINYYPGYQNVTSQYGQKFSGYNQLVYEPIRNATGYDVFEFNYCAGGQTTNCPLVKVEIEIVDFPVAGNSMFCAGKDCVWSGDANNDGAVDVRDILPIGLLMGSVGNARPNASLSWYGQFANNWNSISSNLGVDAKYVDADGNGIVSALDTSAIRKFYGKYHNLTPEPTAGSKQLPFYIEEPVFTTIQPGDVLYAPIRLGNESLPAIDAYGLSFAIDYDPTLFKSVKIIFNEKSWMTYDSPILSMTHKPYDGKIEAGYTRTSGKAANGFGRIGVLEFIVIDDIIGIRLKSGNTKVTLQPMGLMDGSGNTIGLDGNSLTLNLKLGQEKGNNDASIDQLVVFPNPASSLVNVQLNGIGNEMERVMLYDMLGRLVYDSGSIMTKRTSLDLSKMAQGVYQMKVTSSNGAILNTRIEVVGSR